MPRILLVEDDVDVRLIMEHALIDGGYEVDVTGTVSGASELLESRSYDLMLADGRMPDGLGMELAATARVQGTRTLIVTGYAFDLPRASLDHFDILLKPVRPGELLEAVERALKADLK